MYPPYHPVHPKRLRITDARWPPSVSPRAVTRHLDPGPYPTSSTVLHRWRKRPSFVSKTRCKPRRPFPVWEPPLPPVSETHTDSPATVEPSPDDSLAPVDPYLLEGLWPAPSAPLTPNPQPKRSRSRHVIPRTRPPRRIQPDIAAQSRDFDREVEAVRRAIATTPARAAPSSFLNRVVRSHCPKVRRSIRTLPGEDTVLFTRRNSELGRLWSSDNDQNLLSEYQLERYGIGIVKLAGGKFLRDHAGRRFRPASSTPNTSFPSDGMTRLVPFVRRLSSWTAVRLSISSPRPMPIALGFSLAVATFLSVALVAVLPILPEAVHGSPSFVISTAAGVLRRHS